MATTSGTRRFEAIFKKVPGTLSVTATHVAWVPTTPGAMDRQSQALNRVTSMAASTAASPRVSLKLAFKDDVPAGGLLFTFTSADNRKDREAVQDMIIPFVAANRAPAAESSTASPAALSKPASAVATPAGATPASTPGTPSSVAKGKRKAKDGPALDEEARLRQTALRKKVVDGNATLRDLHKHLVLGKHISEDEFWEGREALLRARELEDTQLAGRASRILDDRFVTGADSKTFKGGTGRGVKSKATDNGSTTFSLTPAVVHEIFEEFPVVMDAFNKHVPDRVSNGVFWSRYFNSRLWEQHRASERKTATDDGTRPKDDIFDVYLEDPDWDPTPRKEMPSDVDRFLDLQATEEDHGDATTLRDVTMQAGRERTSLPLIRRFNDHSEKLLRAGKPKAGETVTTNGLPMVDSTIYDEIEYSDLLAPAAPAQIALEVADADKDADKEAANVIVPGKSDAELRELADGEADRVRSWDINFAEVSLPNPSHATASGPPPDDLKPLYDQFNFQREAQALAMKVVRDMHLASNKENEVYAPIPEGILEQMRICHISTNEFLRQYWSAVLPPPPGSLGAGTGGQTPSEREKRAAKMAKYLAGTEGRVNAIVNVAMTERFDPERVRSAMAPTLGAVNVALARERKRAKVV
ncbi:RNA polymerase II transcription factor B subunit 1 [Vanrija albida]|uniref:RNA polymerase II transcription factor B subunit 1 n=1 Tax=Vanrija albida TaxID=181172 RepID=A0ABR3QB59_9TREE